MNGIGDGINAFHGRLPYPFSIPLSLLFPSLDLSHLLYSALRFIKKALQPALIGTSLLSPQIAIHTLKQPFGRSQSTLQLSGEQPKYAFRGHLQEPCYSRGTNIIR